MPVLFFYSNKGDCPKCEQQGFVLTNFKRTYKDVRIYHFDINIDNPALNTIKDLYKIKYAPAIVFREDTYHGFMTKTVLENLLNNQNASKENSDDEEYAKV